MHNYYLPETINSKYLIGTISLHLHQNPTSQITVKIKWRILNRVLNTESYQWSVKGSRIYNPKHDCRSSGHTTPKYATLVCWLFWTASTSNAAANAGGGFLWTALICLKTYPPKETQLSQIPSPRVSSAKKDRLLSQETRLDIDTTARQTLSQTVIPPIYSSKTPFNPS